MGKLGRFFNKVLVRYLLSYLLVLTIPLLVFSLLHEQYFIQLYRDEIFRQNIQALDNISLQMQMHLQEMDAILVQLSSNVLLERSSLRSSAPTYTGMKVLLRGILSSHPFYSGGCFYTTQMPGVIYTENGTYNPAYYWKLQREGHFVSLPDYLQDLKTPEWCFPADISAAPGAAGPKAGLTRIMPLPAYEGGYLLLTIDEPYLQALTEQPQAETYLFDQFGLQLYPIEPMPQEQLAELVPLQNSGSYQLLSGGRYALYSSFHEGSIRCVRLLSEADILSPVKKLQNTYHQAQLLLLTCGGALVYLLAFLSYRPIRQLDEMVDSRAPEIPENLYGIQKASYLIETMEQRVASLQQQNAMEKLLLCLLHDRIDENWDLEKECVAAGIDCYAEQYRIVLLHLGAEPEKRFPLAGILEQVLGSEFSWQMMEYPDEANLLLLLGFGEACSYIISDKLSVIADRLLEETGLSARIAAGGSYSSLREISRSYQEAVAAERLGPQPEMGETAAVSIPQRPQAHFIYPKLELDALCTALVNVDMERARFMLEVLLDIARSETLSNFTRSSLCFDIMKCYARAYEGLNREALRTDFRLEGIYCETEPEPAALIERINALHGRFSCDMLAQSQRSVPEEKPEDTIAQVLAYIDAHWRDSELCVSSVADAFSLSLSNLSHRFKMQTGRNISAYISEKKMMYAKELLATSSMTLSEISEKVGYKQTTSFIRKFKQLVNATPNEYREQCAAREGSSPES